MNKINEQNMLAALIIGACIATVIFCTWWFPKLDCYNAKQGLAFIEHCQASDDCSLTASELELKRVYTRLEIKSCPKD